MKCKECNERDVYIRKSGLCKRCYMRLYQRYNKDEKKGENDTFNSIHLERKIKHENEMEFIKNYFKHDNWFYEPVTFHLEGFNYIPDFYDGERNVFIEVVGTRQAFSNNKHKYELFYKKYGDVFKLEILDKFGNSAESLYGIKKIV